MDDTEFIQLAKEKNLDAFKQAQEKDPNLDFSKLFNDNLMYLNIPELEFFGREHFFQIQVNIQDNACFLNAKKLEFFLTQGLPLKQDGIEALIGLGDCDKLAVLMKHSIEIPAEIVFGWIVMDCVEPLKTYLENGGDPNLKDEDGNSLIDRWYEWKNESEAIHLLETHGATLTPGCETIHEKASFLQDLANDPFRWSNFQQVVKEWGDKFPELSQDDAIEKIKTLRETPDYNLQFLQKQKEKILLNQQEEINKEDFSEERKKRYQEALSKIDLEIAENQAAVSEKQSTPGEQKPC